MVSNTRSSLMASSWPAIPPYASTPAALGWAGDGDLPRRALRLEADPFRAKRRPRRSFRPRPSQFVIKNHYNAHTSFPSMGTSAVRSRPPARFIFTIMSGFDSLVGAKISPPEPPMEGVPRLGPPRAAPGLGRIEPMATGFRPSEPFFGPFFTLAFFPLPG